MDLYRQNLALGCNGCFSQSWALPVFFNVFNNKKWFFAFFIKFIWLGVDFLNRTGAEINYELEKMQKNHFLFLKKLQKIPKVPSSGLFLLFKVVFHIKNRKCPALLRERNLLFVYKRFPVGQSINCIIESLHLSFVTFGVAFFPPLFLTDKR